MTERILLIQDGKMWYKCGHGEDRKGEHYDNGMKCEAHMVENVNDWWKLYFCKKKHVWFAKLTVRFDLTPQMFVNEINREELILNFYSGAPKYPSSQVDIDSS